MADAHKKRQKQIRMSDELRDRFERLQRESGLKGDEFIKLLLSKHEQQDEPSNAELLQILKDRLKD